MRLTPWHIVFGALLAAAAQWLPLERVWAARTSAEHAADLYEQALRAERELIDLRAALPDAARADAPSGDVAALVQQAVHDAGLPAQVIAEVSPREGGSVVSNSGASGGTNAARWKRQSVQVRLNPLALPDIGAFLHQMRSTAAEWTVSQAELQVEPPRTTAHSASNDTVLYRLSCTLTCTYLDSPR